MAWDGRLLRRGLKVGHLRLLAALAEAHDEAAALGTAAARLGLAQPAASRLLAEAEGIVGRPLRERAGRGLRLTPEGAALAARAGRALAEIALAEREVAEAALGGGGHVRIGSVTGPALDRVLPALAAAPEGVTCEVEVAPSDRLADLLLAGRLDFALARLPSHREAGLFDWAPVAVEPVSLVARAGHPLAAGARAQDALGFDWVMPGEGAVLRRAVLERLAALGLPAPRVRVATASFLFTLAMLEATDAVAPLATAVAARFGAGAVAPLPLDLGIVVPTWGAMTRRGARLTPAAERVRALVAV